MDSRHDVRGSDFAGQLDRRVGSSSADCRHELGDLACHLGRALVWQEVACARKETQACTCD